MSEPLRLPEVERSEIGWRNELSGTKRQIAFRVGDTDSELTFLHTGRISPSKRVVLSAGSLRWEIGLSDWDRLPFVEQNFGIDILSSLPDEIALAVLETLFEPQLNWLADRLGIPCELSEFVSSPAPQLPHMNFCLKALSKEILGTIHGETAAMSILQDMVSSVPKLSSIDVSSIPLVASAEIGRTSLTFDEIKGLSSGDVVMMDEGELSGTDSLLFHFADGLTWKAKVNENRIVFEEPLTLPTDVQEANNPTISLAFERGRIQMSGSQLAALEPGSSIPLIESATVTIVANHKPIATGELVSISERTGIRITEISSRITPPVQAVEEIDAADEGEGLVEPETEPSEPV